MQKLWETIVEELTKELIKESSENLSEEVVQELFGRKDNGKYSYSKIHKIYSTIDKRNQTLIQLRKKVRECGILKQYSLRSVCATKRWVEFFRALYTAVKPELAAYCNSRRPDHKPTCSKEMAHILEIVKDELDMAVEDYKETVIRQKEKIAKEKEKLKGKP